MAEDGSTAPPSPSRQRRSSLAGQTFADLFGTGRPSVSRPSNEGTNNNSPPTQFPGPISQAAAKAQQRRLSLTTIGLSGAQTSTSPYNSYRGRQDSISSANSGSLDESAIEEDVGPSSVREPAGTPFARRISFGARALRDVSGGRGSGGGGGGGGEVGGGGSSPGQNGTRSPAASASAASTTTTPPASKQTRTISARAADAKGREGFNWSDNFRTRAERTASIAGGGSGGTAIPPSFSASTGLGPGGNHVRAKSVATMEPPVREMPKEQKRPDHFQERILKGDFYMD